MRWRWILALSLTVGAVLAPIAVGEDGGGGGSSTASTNQALEAAGVTGASASVQTTSDADSSMLSSTAAAIVDVPVDPSSGVSVVAASGSPVVVSLPGAATLADAQPVANGIVGYNGGDDTSTAVQVLTAGSDTTSCDGVRIMTVINGSDAPTSYAFALSVPTGGAVAPDGVGGYTITDADGAVIATVAAPWAKDANGSAVPVSYALDGTTLTMSVTHAGAAYPVVADPQICAAANAAPGTAPEITSGTLLNGDGSPAIATVSLYLLSNDPSVPQSAPPVALSTTDATGSFSLDVADSPDIQAAQAANGGWANFMLLATTSSYGYQAYFSRSAADFGRALSNGGTRAVHWVARGGEAAPSLHVRLSQRAAGVFRVVRQPARSLANGGPTPVCLWQPGTTKTNVATVVGELHTPADSSATFTYGQSADSDVSVGVSADGVHWSLSGTEHVGTSRSNSFTAPLGASSGRLITSGFEYTSGTWKWSIVGGLCGNKYSVRPGTWDGGGNFGADVSSLDNHCKAGTKNTQDLGPGYTWSTGTEAAHTFDGGVSVFGVGLGVRSGFSRNVQAHWVMGRSAHHYLCGSDGPTTTASRIYAGLG
jgi:hypothetical protein